MMRSRPATSLVEAIIGLSLFSILSIGLWTLFQTFVGGSSKMSVVTGASRTLVQQQSRLALRKLFFRLQEAIQIVEPTPGQSGATLVFRDILNRSVRLRHDRATRSVMTERFESGAWQRETDADTDASLVKPIQVPFCDNVVFTALSPTAVLVGFTTADSTVADSFMSILHLANSKLAQ